MDKFISAAAVISIIVLVGLLVSSLFTFVIGLFLNFDFTIWNILKVWGALVCFNLLASMIRG